MHCVGTSSVASPICHEGQSERNFPIFAFSSRFFLFSPDFSWFFPDFSQIFGKFSLSGVALCPPRHPSGYATGGDPNSYLLPKETVKHPLYSKTDITNKKSNFYRVYNLQTPPKEMKFCQFLLKACRHVAPSPVVGIWLLTWAPNATKPPSLQTGLEPESATPETMIQHYRKGEQQKHYSVTFHASIIVIFWCVNNLKGHWTSVTSIFLYLIL